MPCHVTGPLLAGPVQLGVKFSQLAPTDKDREDLQIFEDDYGEGSDDSSLFYSSYDEGGEDDDENNDDDKKNEHGDDDDDFGMRSGRRRRNLKIAKSIL